MAKTDAKRSSTRRSKVVTSEVVEAEGDVKTEGQSEHVGTEEDAPKETHDEQGSQMDAVIEVKGSSTTVSVSWDKKNEEEEGDAPEKINSDSDQMLESADAVDSTEDAPSENPETKVKIETQESEESQMDIIAGSTATVTLTWEEKNEVGDSNNVEKETNGCEEAILTNTPVKGKRKAAAAAETSPPKKTKLINDGFCLFVGNLNNSKTFDEVKDSLANFFMKQSLLVQDIRLDRSRKHAFIDLASEMDLTKGLTLNGEMMHDKPMKIAKAKVKNKDTVKVKASAAEKKAAKDDRCLYLKNVPYNATKEDILKIFPKGVSVRFPGGAEAPKEGIAFVEFKSKAITTKVLKQKQRQEVKMQGRVLVVSCVGKKPKANDDEGNTKKAAAPPNNTLFVSKLPFNVNEKSLKKIFQKAVSVNIPKIQGTTRGFAFVTFATVEEAEKALQSSQNLKLNKRVVQVQFGKGQEESDHTKVPSKTLFVMDLAEKTTAETLKSVFDGALSARVTVDKVTGVSKRFGFVEFESKVICKAVKEAMEDCEIDGSKVALAYAKESKGVNSQEGPAIPPPAKSKGGKGSEGPAKPPPAKSKDVKGSEGPAKPPPAKSNGGKGSEGPAKPPLAPGGQPAGPESGKGRRKRKRSKGGKGSGAGTPQDAGKEVENAA